MTGVTWWNKFDCQDGVRREPSDRGRGTRLLLVDKPFMWRNAIEVVTLMQPQFDCENKLLLSANLFSVLLLHSAVIISHVSLKETWLGAGSPFSSC